VARGTIGLVKRRSSRDLGREQLFFPEEQSRPQIAVTALLMAAAGAFGLYEMIYGAWAASWNLGRTPPSYGGAVLCAALALAVPAAVLLMWRRGRRRGDPSRTVLISAAGVGAMVGFVVLLFIAFAALMATGF
jgi:hypothetical protein